MHSSRMHTSCSLTICRSLLPGVGGWGWCLLLGVCSQGVSIPGGGLFMGGCLLQRGVSALGVSVQGSGGVSPLGGVCSGGVCLLWGCVSAPRGVSALGGACLLWGVSTPRGSFCSGGWHPSMLRGRHPPVNRMTNRRKNITLATTSFRPVKITQVYLRSIELMLHQKVCSILLK